jgi:uncharacterized protein
MDISSEMVKRAAAYVKKKMQDEHSGHDWRHIERVRAMAVKLQKKEGGDLHLIELAVLLHDLGDYRQQGFSEIKGSFVLRGMMDVLDVEEDLKEKLVEIIGEAEFYGEETKKPKTIEGKILQDADWLDALGAVGIARVFATGGSNKRMLHDPAMKPRTRPTKAEYLYKKSEGTSYNYFFEKILKIPKMMNTETAQKIAERRAKFTEDFLDQFKKEWEGEK